MTFKKKSNVSKTFLSSLVIFNLVFTTAAMPVVSLAFDGTSPATQTEQGDTPKEEKGDKGDKGGKEEDPSGRTNPGDPTKPDTGKPSKEGDGSTTGGNDSGFNRGNKGEVKGEETSCDVGNLIANGSFENPVVTNPADWNIYADGSVPNWNVAWHGSFAGAPKTANMEIQSGVMGWNAYVGSQYVELDSDWGGPSDPMYGEQASSIISQTIDTVPGNTYKLHFAFAARPGTAAAENRLGIYIDDGVFDLSSISAFGEYYSDQPYWIVREYEFKAYNEQTKIAFADLGTPNSIGTFLDDVRVNCVKEGGKGCPADNMIYARVKLTPQPYGWRNWGNGNTSGKIFVGGSDNSDVYMTNEWFPLTNPDGSFIEDADIAAYRDVPGLALQRSEGTVRIVLYGYLYDEVKAGDSSTDKSGSTPNIRNYYMLNRELSQGSLEFSTDMATRSTVVIPVSQMDDAANPMDHVAGVHQYHPGSDSFRLISNLSQWHLLVTTGSDGFYTKYEDKRSDDGKDCPPEEKTGSLIVNKVINGQGNGTFHFNGPNGTFDITTSNGEGSLQINDLEEGTYTVTEQSMAGWETVSSTCTNVVVTEDNEAECTIVNTLDDGGPGCEGNDCPGEGSCDSGAIWARVNVEDFSNLGTGNVTSNIYLGSNSNIVASGEWFMVYDGTNFINDADISGYEDVPGLAIQRMNGKLRTTLFGTEAESIGHREYIEGNIEFFNGLVTTVYEDADPYYKLEDGTDGQFDYISYAGDRAYFDIQVQDKGGDSFYTKYFYSLDEDCDDDKGDPDIEVGDVCILYGTDFPMDRITITNNANGEYDQSNIFITDLNTFHADIPGDYPLTITLKNDDGVIVAGPYNYVFTVAPANAKDCDNGGDGHAPVITVTGQSCVSLAVTSFNFALGAIATDVEDGVVTLSIDSSDVEFGNSGIYTVIYSATDSDGNTTTLNRNFAISANCDNGGDDETPTITTPGQSCFLLNAKFDLMDGVSATDDEDGNITDAVIVDSSAVIFGTAGTYTVTYTVTDSDGNTTTVTRSITISENCDNGGDGQNPEIAISQYSCVSTGVLSYDFAAGATATDPQDGNIAVTIDSSAVIFGTVGTYNVVYSATDSDGNTTTTVVPFTVSENCGGTGGGDDDNPVITTPGEACILLTATSADFSFMDGVAANDDEDGNLTSDIIVDSSAVIFGTAGTYTVTYSVTDSMAQTTTVTRTITIDDDCDNGGGGGGGDDDDDNGGGGSSGGRSRNRGEVLGAESCVAFTQYNDTGSTKSEVKAVQTFLNEYMDAGLTVNGIYDRATTQAVHDFQALHWDDIIDPWTPPLSPNTTGREYKTTRATMNAIMDCPEAPVFLEDPQTMFSIIEVKNQKAFSQSQIDTVAELLIEAQAGGSATDAK